MMRKMHPAPDGGKTGDGSPLPSKSAQARRGLRSRRRRGGYIPHDHPSDRATPLYPPGQHGASALTEELHGCVHTRVVVFGAPRIAPVVVRIGAEGGAR